DQQPTQGDGGLRSVEATDHAVVITTVGFHVPGGHGDKHDDGDGPDHHAVWAQRTDDKHGLIGKPVDEQGGQEQSDFRYEPEPTTETGTGEDAGPDAGHDGETSDAEQWVRD